MQIHELINKRTMTEIDVYGTTIRQTKIELVPDLVDKIYKLKENFPGEKTTNHGGSNRGGWRSVRYDEHSIDWMSPIVEQVQHAAAKTGPITYWFNVNGIGHYNELHDHGDFGTNLCGCLYVQVPPLAGGITFQQVKGKKTTTIILQAGDLLLFPDNIKHSVSENKSSSDRITIAFNFWKMVK